jgi:hypothetical protein
MPATNRSSRFPRAAVLIPLLAALGGCAAASPLLQLGATPMPQAAPCTQNTLGTSDGNTSACNAGTTGSMIPGMASLMQVFSPATAQSH